MRFLLILSAFAGLTACGPSTTGPGEISGFGLVYDQRPGRQFEGLPRTTADQMPKTIGKMTGPSRIQSNDGTLVFSDATMVVNVDTGQVRYAADYEFPEDHALGLIQVRRTGQLEGAKITSDGGTNFLSGNFYGTDGAVAAGFYSQNAAGGENLFGAYIVSSEN